MRDFSRGALFNRNVLAVRKERRKWKNRGRGRLVKTGLGSRLPENAIASVPILLAVSPLEAMRSAPVTIAPTFPVFRKCPTILSDDQREGMPALCVPRGSARLEDTAAFQARDVDLFPWRTRTESIQAPIRFGPVARRRRCMRHHLALAGHEPAPKRPWLRQYAFFERDGLASQHFRLMLLKSNLGASRPRSGRSCVKRPKGSRRWGEFLPACHKSSKNSARSTSTISRRNDRTQGPRPSRRPTADRRSATITISRVLWPLRGQSVEVWSLPSRDGAVENDHADVQSIRWVEYDMRSGTPKTFIVTKRRRRKRIDQGCGGHLVKPWSTGAAARR